MLYKWHIYSVGYLKLTPDHSSISGMTINHWENDPTTQLTTQVIHLEGQPLDHAQVPPGYRLEFF
jgi:hypothetical protein